MNIHFIVAMQDEAKHIIDALNLTKNQNNSLNFDIYEGQYLNQNLRLFVNQKDRHGMDKLGTMQVGLLTYKAIQYQKPDLIISIGTSGGIVAHDVQVFDIVCGADKVIYHDRFTGDNEGSIKQSLCFAPCVSLKEILTDKTFKHGVVGSSNSLLVTPRSWKLFYQYQVKCVDMEAAAVGEIAYEHSIPFVALKVVTDNVYEVNPVDAFSQFESNFHPAMKTLAEKLPQILSQLQPALFPSQDSSNHLNSQTHSSQSVS